MFDKIKNIASDVLIGEPRFDEEVYSFTYNVHADTVTRHIDQQTSFDVILKEVGRPFAQRLHVEKDMLIKKIIYKKLSDIELIQVRNIINEILSERKY